MDDHPPLFKRSLNESPLLMRVEEESPLGTEVGLIECQDPDIGENANIDYVISGGFLKTVHSA